MFLRIGFVVAHGLSSLLGWCGCLENSLSLGVGLRIRDGVEIMKSLFSLAAAVRDRGSVGREDDERSTCEMVGEECWVGRCVSTG